MSKITICHYSSNTTIERLYQRNLINATQGNSQNSRKKQASKDNTDTFANNIIQKKKPPAILSDKTLLAVRNQKRNILGLITLYLCHDDGVFRYWLVSSNWTDGFVEGECSGQGRSQLTRWLVWRQIWIKIFGIQNKFVWNSKHDAWNLTGLERFHWTQNFLLRLPVFSSSRPDVFLLNLQTRRFLFKNSLNQMYFFNISHNQMVF